MTNIFQRAVRTLLRLDRKDVGTGLALEGFQYWDVSGRYEPEALIKNLPLLIGDTDAGFLHLEGIGTDEALRTFVLQNAVPNVPRAKSGTVWPKYRHYALPAIPPILQWTAKFLSHEAGLAFCCHFHVSVSSRLLVSAYDFGMGDFGMSADIPEEKVAQLCGTLGCTYRLMPLLNGESSSRI